MSGVFIKFMLLFLIYGVLLFLEILMGLMYSALTLNSIILYPLYRSDVLGQFMPLVGIDWSQTGVAHLFSAIKVCCMVCHLFFFLNPDIAA